MVEAAAVRRLVTDGPPVYLFDKSGVALPVPDGDTHIDMLWFCATGEEEEAVLEGALQGEARETLWAEQKAILAAMEMAEEENSSGESKEAKENKK